MSFLYRDLQRVRCHRSIPALEGLPCPEVFRIAAVIESDDISPWSGISFFLGHCKQPVERFGADGQAFARLQQGKGVGSQREREWRREPQEILSCGDIREMRDEIDVHYEVLINPLRQIAGVFELYLNVNRFPSVIHSLAGCDRQLHI